MTSIDTKIAPELLPTSPERVEREAVGLLPGTALTLARLALLDVQPDRIDVNKRHLGLKISSLHGNTMFYPEMKERIDSAEVEAAMERLLDLPLVHRTSFAGFENEDGTRTGTSPLPRANLPENHESNTYAFDRKKGLDEYTFMAWGSPYLRRGQSFLRGSRYAVLIDPRQILLDDRCIATPKDVAEVVSGDVLYGNNQQLSGKSERLDRRRKRMAKSRQAEADYNREYLSKVVTGSDWLEIQARRLVLRAHKEGVSLEAIKLSADDLGEVKFKGPIPEAAIIDVIDTYDAKDYSGYEKLVRSSARLLLKGTTGFGRRFLR